MTKAELSTDVARLLDGDGPLVLDLGCGRQKRPGSVGIDAVALPGVDIVANVDDGLPFLPDESLRRHGSSHATLLAPEFLRENHAAVRELVELAWRDLDEARAYLLQLPRRAVSIRLFCALPLLFAYATLRELTGTTAMLSPGGAPKITRHEVKRLLAGGTLAAASNTGLDWLVEQARRGRFVPGRV